ncbi:MAG: PspC domain-containing protein [Candidatus Saccharibacteria bacterium]
MNKVTTINLSGRAFQLEEQAYEALHKYLESARRELADDPDKDEVMQDFEQAIADKCAPLLKNHKDVITTTEIKKIIKSMGDVEAATSEDDSHAQKSETVQPAPKRLYLLREGAIIGGVCNGLAAYLNLDVTILRLIFIILAFVSGGFWVVVYLLMMLVVPDAVTPEQKAELRGERFTAQDVISKAKQKYADVADREHWQKVGRENAPSLESAGKATLFVARLLAAASAVVSVVIAGLMSAAWIATMWWLATGNLHLQDQLRGISTWTVAVAATATYAAIMLPTLVLTQILVRLARGRKFQQRDKRWLITAGVLWLIAAGILGGMQIAYQPRINAYDQTHGTVNIQGHQICINDNLCGDNGQQMTPLQFDQNFPRMRGFAQ